MNLSLKISINIVEYKYITFGMEGKIAHHGRLSGMKKVQWETLKKCAAMEKQDKIPVGLIVDSPWMPGYVGISTLDYFTVPEKWFDANMKIKRDFPELIFIPDFWVEYGMAAEPSSFGCKINFYENNTPTVNHIIPSADDMDMVSNIQVPNPKTDGLLPFALNLYRNMEPKIKDAGESIKIVAGRGPLAIGTHLMGLTEFLVAMKIDPDNMHKLLKITTILVKNWLEAQADVLTEVEGILVLDDIVGFLSKDDYLEFAHPYLKEIFDAFPKALKIYHNDTDGDAYYGYLEELGVNIFNFTHKKDIADVRAKVGNKVCLLGNVPPLDELVQGTPESVGAAARKCLENYGATEGLILSAGGGASPGTPKENIRAMIAACG